jgi:hypothetical protein
MKEQDVIDMVKAGRGAVTEKQARTILQGREDRAKKEASEKASEGSETKESKPAKKAS